MRGETGIESKAKEKTDWFARKRENQDGEKREEMSAESERERQKGKVG